MKLSKLVKCKQKRTDCFAYDARGYCTCLKDTKFSYKCPFYKNYHEVYDTPKATK